MRGTWVGLAVAAIVATGCGDGNGAAAGERKPLRVYTSLELPGGAGLVRAQQLALSDAGGRAGGHEVELVVLNASGPERRVAAERIDANVYKAVSDPRAVAYIGESNSESTALAMPRVNRAGLLHLAPSATYTGFTKPIGAQPGEPAKFSPSGRRTFGRVIPADDVQSAALLAAVRREGFERAYALDDTSIYGTGLLRLVRELAPDAGVEVVEDPALGAAAGTPDGLGRAMVARGLRAIIYTGCLAPQVAARFLEVSSRLMLFTGDCQTQPVFVEEVGDEGAAMRIVAPAPDPADQAARDFAERYETRFGVAPEPQAYFAYESMAVVLDAIRRADGAGRAGVVDAFFATRDREGVVGRYSIDRRGDTTLRTVSAFRVEDRRLVHDGTITAE